MILNCTAETSVFVEGLISAEIVFLEDIRKKTKNLLVYILKSKERNRLRNYYRYRNYKRYYINSKISPKLNI